MAEPLIPVEADALGRRLVLQLVDEPYLHMGASGIVMMALGLGGAYIGLVKEPDRFILGLLCVLVLVPYGAWTVWCATRIATRRDSRLVLDADRARFPRAQAWAHGDVEIDLRSVRTVTDGEDRNGAYIQLVLADGTEVRFPERWSPAGSRAAYRLFVRASLGARGHDLDPVKLAGIEAQLLGPNPELGAVVTDGPDGPRVLGLVRDTEHYLQALRDGLIPAQHQLLVANDVKP